jgi:hypothetical protein
LKDLRISLHFTAPRDEAIIRQLERAPNKQNMIREALRKEIERNGESKEQSAAGSGDQ